MGTGTLQRYDFNFKKRNLIQIHFVFCLIYTIFAGRILKIRQYEEVFTDIACPAVRSHAGLMGPRADNIHRTGTVHHNTGQPNGLQVQLPIDQRDGRPRCAIVAVMLLGAYYAIIGFSLSRFVTASYTNAVFDRFINPRIEGAPVNKGLREKEDDDEDEDEAGEEAGEDNKGTEG